MEPSTRKGVWRFSWWSVFFVSEAVDVVGLGSSIGRLRGMVPTVSGRDGRKSSALAVMVRRETSIVNYRL